MTGLTSARAAELLEQVGPNALPARAPTPFWRRFVAQFASPLIYILLFALAFDTAVWLYEGAQGWPVESVAIAVILLLNAALGLYQEQRSEAALSRLEALAGAQAWVLRDGHLVHLPTQDIVPGDVVRLEAGDRVPAAGAIGDAQGAMLDESVLTGESVPVDKGQGDEAFSGTLLVRGRVTMEVVRTGASSAMGKLATLLGDIEASETPLERRVNRLGRQIAVWVLALAAVIGVAGVAAEGLSHAPNVIIFAVALAVAAVPEGLPAVLTVALSLGVERMATQRAVVRRLSAVEALGSVNVIATDKTGTLTENRMDVRDVDAVDLPRALVAMTLANDADPDTDAGDPLDLGLLRHVAARGGDAAAIRAAHPVVSTRPFDSAWKYARTTVQSEGGVVSFLKGAPEVLIPRCRLTDDEREDWFARAEARAAEGFRVLALTEADSEREEDLTLLGLALFWDPPRAEVRDAMALAQAAGIRVVMITGDHPATASAIAGQIGMPSTEALTGDALAGLSSQEFERTLADVSVFARVRPEQKLQIVESLQRSGRIVAMTGDGVNDAPALKRSDVGVAMGQRGSDVSREVADLVLLDDNFATIVKAVEEGRSIYENIQKFLRFLFSTNLSEVLLISAGVVLAFVLGLRDSSGALLVPLTAAQILWINLMTDGLPALALALDRTPGVMQLPPRPADAPLLDRTSLHFIVSAGVIKALLALLVLGLVPALGYSHDTARAAAFHFMAIGQLLLTYPSRHTWMQPLPNRWLHLAVVGGVVVQVGASLLPVTSTMLGGIALPLQLWSLVFVFAALAWASIEALARLEWRRGGG